MALWGRSDGAAITGTVSIEAANTILTGDDANTAVFLSELAPGDFITAEGEEFKVVSITDDATAVVTPAAANTIASANAAISDKPKWLSYDNPVADSDEVINTSVAEAQDANNRAVGVVTPGWTRYKTYTAGPGGSITRHVAETLVAMKDPD